MKRILSFLLAIAMLVSILASCGEDPCTSHYDNDVNGLCDACGADVPLEEITYTVTVKDGKGETVRGVIVKIYEINDTDMENELKMGVTKANGSVSFKLDAGSYNVKLLNTKDEMLVYDTEKITLTEAYPSLEIKVYDEITDTVYSNYGDLPRIAEGSYLSEFKLGELTYFVFIPERMGVYQISFSAEVPVALGLYGNPINILDHDITSDSERVNSKTVKITVNQSNMASENAQITNYTIGIKGTLEAGVGALTVEKVGDVAVIPESKAPVPKDLPVCDYGGGVPTDIDITVSGFSNKYGVVYNADDGYYHLCLNHIPDASHECNENGPVIYVKLANNDSYMNFGAMIEAGNGMSCYIYNAAGEPLEKKDYTEMLMAYIKAADSTYGLYALTDSLREALQNCGAYRGWFGDNSEILDGKIILSQYEGMEYLLFCCYGE